MSVESADVRRRKRVVESQILGFRSAKEALIFGNTVERQLASVQPKFRQYVSATGSKLAVTQDWAGPTTLKMTFMEIEQDAAQHVVEKVKRLSAIHTQVHNPIEIVFQNIREKPQPQSIGI